MKSLANISGLQVIKQILRVGLLYFSLVFAIGFVLGTIRTLWIVPNVGPKIAELMEMPVMLLVTILAARWVVRRLSFCGTPVGRLSVGVVALGLLLMAEFAVVVWIRELTIAQYLASRDPLTGSVYLVMLVAFAVMPLLVRRK